MNPRDVRRSISQLLRKGTLGQHVDATALYSAPAYAAPIEARGLPYYGCRCKGPADRLLANFPRPTTLRTIATLLLGDPARGSELVPDPSFRPEAPFDPRSSFLLPEGMRLPTWEDTVELDRFGRDHLAYWTARCLEAYNNVPGCVMGMMPKALCELGKSGGPGQCCGPTADPFPSKPYFYVLAPGRSFVDVGRDFGRDENGWIELRRANADDPNGFIKLPNEWCVWKVWEPGRLLRIPGNWNEAEYTPMVTGRLVDGHGTTLSVETILEWAQFFLSKIPDRWQTPLHMLLEIAGPEAEQPGFSRSLEHDEVMAKRLVARTFLAK